MRRWRTNTLLICCLILSSMTTAYATRQRYILDKIQQSKEAEKEVEKDYGSITYTDGIPKPGLSGDVEAIDFSKYTYNGEPIVMPDLTKFRDYDVSEIKTFSDAIVDFLGWDALLGTANYDESTKILSFKRIKGNEQDGNRVYGYGRRTFGEETLKFKARLHADNGLYDSWLGLSFRCERTQAMQWVKNPGYLIVMKKDKIELQKWFPGQTMLGIFENNVIQLDTWHEYVLETNKKSDGLEIVLTIDGKEMFRCLDNEEPIAPAEGYVNLFNGQDELGVMPVDITLSNGSGDVQTTGDGITALQVDNNKAYNSGELVDIDSQNELVTPLMESDSVLVPLRFIAESLGAEVSWDETAQTASVMLNGRKLEFTIGFSEYSKDGVFYRMSSKSQNLQGRMFVPVRVFSEAFSKSVFWDNGTVYISEKDNEPDEDTKQNIRELLQK